MKALISLAHDAEQIFRDLNRAVSGPLTLFGVDGKNLSAWQYFVYGVSGRRWPLTPGEVGCSLSHLAALREFLASNDQVLTVYEADAFVRDEFCEPESIFKLYEERPIVLHLGGHEGVLRRSRLFGKVVCDMPGVKVWELSRYSTRWLFRTCGYMVNREAAAIIAKAYQRRLQRADDWGKLLQGRQCVFLYAHMVSHPLHLNDSLLQSERSQLHRPSLIHRFGARLRGALTLFCLKLSGNSRIP
jgi:glycosyl transferase family 25